MTTSRNYEDLKNGFSREQLPIAFQDAAAVAQSLNIRYLWIDTLCIIQDSTVDWEEQAAKMGDIFEGATLTISAASSLDPYHTLFEARSPQNQEIELISNIEQTHHDVVFKARRKIARGIHAKTGRSVDTDPLDLRAWGLQEKLLSTRLIAFTGAEIQWTCRTLRACECHQHSYPSQPLFPAPPSGTSSAETDMGYAKIWSQIIEEYSVRNLTVLEDKLPALSGLACKFGVVTGFTYIAGLWKETLLYDLVWQRDGSPLEAPTTWLGPSFSWASAYGAVNFRFARHSYPGARIHHAELLEECYKTVGKDVYSRAMDGWLTVQGQTVAAVLRSSKDYAGHTLCINGADYSPSTDQRAICEFSIDASQEQDGNASEHMQNKIASEDTSQGYEEAVIILSLYSIYHQRYLYQNFLILARSHRHVGCYERIGIGSGKLYRGSSYKANIPSEKELVRPFEWLLVDHEQSGRGMGIVMEQIMCIR